MRATSNRGSLRLMPPGHYTEGDLSSTRQTLSIWRHRWQLSNAGNLSQSYRNDARREEDAEAAKGLVTRAQIQNTKGSKERLFIMTQTHNLHIFGVIPFVKLRNDNERYCWQGFRYDNSDDYRYLRRIIFVSSLLGLVSLRRSARSSKRRKRKGTI